MGNGSKKGKVSVHGDAFKDGCDKEVKGAMESLVNDMKPLVSFVVDVLFHPTL